MAFYWEQLHIWWGIGFLRPLIQSNSPQAAFTLNLTWLWWFLLSKGDAWGLGRSSNLPKVTHLVSEPGFKFVCPRFPWELVFQKGQSLEWETSSLDLAYVRNIRDSQKTLNKFSFRLPLYPIWDMMFRFPEMREKTGDSTDVFQPVWGRGRPRGQANLRGDIKLGVR